MSTTIARPPRRATHPPREKRESWFRDASWRLYEAFVENLPEGSPIRTAFDGRDMEIMVTGPLHDHFADLLDQFVKAVAGELGIRIKPLGETTWIRPEIERGIEADNCYYLDPAKIATALAALSGQVQRREGLPQPRSGDRGRHLRPGSGPGGNLRRDGRRGGLAFRRPEPDDRAARRERPLPGRRAKRFPAASVPTRFPAGSSTKTCPTTRPGPDGSGPGP